MKSFSGDRTIDGVKATVDGQPLDQRLDVHRYTANGFEWSYEGDEPRQLALAILTEHLNDPAAAKALVEPFMKAVVANFGNEWEMNTADIDAALDVLRGAPLRAASCIFEGKVSQGRSRTGRPPFTRGMACCRWNQSRPPISQPATCWSGSRRPVFVILI